MRRILLFSTQTPNNAANLSRALFPDWLQKKRFAFMPSDGAESQPHFREYWESLAREQGAEFIAVINSYTGNRSKEEAKKLLDCDILFLSGGNTFRFLRNLRRSGLDQAVIEFSQRDGTVLAGASAGALVLTSSIGVCEIEGVDENHDGFTDLAGLDIAGFDIFPHYEPKWDEAISTYETAHATKLRKITDDQILQLDIRKINSPSRSK